MMKHNHLAGKRFLSLLLASALAFACALPAAAVEPLGSGVMPTYDEAYYAMLDYYGNLTEGSVVKSYTLNGANRITDYGKYDSVNNLTDSTLHSTTGSKTTFDFGSTPPEHFYFEGKATQPFETLPWTISMSYKLNGVPTKAEDLAGKTGVVEIDLNFVPNESASSYARNNYTLEAMAVFNQDDILSLKAEGAQVQLVGNLRIVLFLCLPGEEQHFTIEVGTNDFSFGGMTLLMVPATLSQLEQIADISQKKDDLEDDYHKLSGSLDDLLSAMNSLTSSLNASANGLDVLNQARGTFSNGKGTLYEGTDLLKGDLNEIATLLDPLEKQVQALSQLVTNSKSTLNSMTDIVVSLQDQLKDMEDALENLEDGKGDLQDLLQSAADMRSSLNRLKRALNSISGGSSGGSSGDSGSGNTSSREMVKKVKAVHSAYEETDLISFMAKMLLINGTASSNTEAETMAAGLAALAVLTSAPAGMEENWRSAQQLKALYGYAHSGASFQSFCEQLPGVSKAEAKQMNDLWIVYSSGKLESEGTLTSAEGNTGNGEETMSASLLHNDPAGDTGSPDDNSPSDSSTIDSNTSDSCTSGSSTSGSSSTESGSGESNSGNSDSTEGTGSPDSESPSESDSVGGAAIDLITSGLDDAMSSINSIKNELTSTMKSIAGPTASVVGDLADLCDSLDDIIDLLDDAEDLSYAARQSSKKLRSILDDADELRELLNDYEPTLQDTLQTVSGLGGSAAVSVRDTVSLIDSAEDLLKRSGTQLDNGTKQTLESLASVLRRTANVMATSGSIQTSKKAMTSIIEDLWNDHTGDVDNLLMMDATAQAESLTDPRNGTPQSVQVMIRTQEIKVEDSEEAEADAQVVDNGTFWSRVAQMFKDFWAAITGIFH